ncbi:uncharacterized protein LOC101851140 [Aplysia californica]|uniref:Uncharacterized protein LOC101851140 n=1 Tax=Aplysia californica TaxID=6500 RepID=A0ABM0JZS9_APLCA|nr:uncharacterized protein LOC101851140 [Aplysia californica]
MEKTSESAPADLNPAAMNKLLKLITPTPTTPEREPQRLRGSVAKFVAHRCEGSLKGVLFPELPANDKSVGKQVVLDDALKRSENLLLDYEGTGRTRGGSPMPLKRRLKGDTAMRMANRYKQSMEQVFPFRKQTETSTQANKRPLRTRSPSSCRIKDLMEPEVVSP